MFQYKENFIPLNLKNQSEMRKYEYDIFAKVTSSLILAEEQKSSNYKYFIEKIMDNLNLWSTIACDVAHISNGLDAKTRESLFYLYQFTEHHSRQIMKDEANVAALIDINRSIMRGLSPTGGAS